MKIFDSLSQKFIELPGEIGRKLRLFVCGPTVYDYPHIGHARTYLAFDIVVRWLRAREFRVYYLQNITDIDDKIIDRAREKGISPLDLARRFENIYHKAEELLNINSVNKYARASNYINEIIKQTKTLIEKGFAYETEDGVYFSVEKFPDYGKLSGQNRERILAGARVEINENKKDPTDFALWKKAKLKPKNNSKFQIVEGEPMWKSPWGYGRPGWHIEDTAITQKHFGPQYEIHGGASELKFPHHEAEIAQQESASGLKPMVKIWMHTGVLLVDGKKMSKSLKNFITIEDFVNKYGADVLRLLVLKYSYRSPIDYSEKVAEESKSALNSILEFMTRIKFVLSTKHEEKDSSVIDIEKYEKAFTESMDNDFNTPEALSHIFSAIKETESKIYNIKEKELKKVYKFVSEKLKILGFINTIPRYEVPKEIRSLLNERRVARSNAQFTHSDALRKKIEELGYKVEDTPIGQFVLKNK